jgi:hypothetical protein
MVTHADAKTPKEIDSRVVVGRGGDSIVERIHARDDGLVPSHRRNISRSLDRAERGRR